jgi:long-chain acyl-CoA synthetase
MMSTEDSSAALFEASPEKPAVIEGTSGAEMSYASLGRLSMKLATEFRHSGLRQADRIATLLANRAETLAVYWAAQRSGLYYAPIPTRLSPDEAAFIVNDSQASALVVGPEFQSLGTALITRTPSIGVRWSLGWSDDHHKEIPDPVQLTSGDAHTVAAEGMPFFYSSGTTGRPKGIMRPLPSTPFGTWRPLAAFDGTPLQLDATSVYLGAGPLYHAAPLNFGMTVHRSGGTLVLMEKFDPLTALELIERHRVTHTQLVPTMLKRILDLSATVRASYDLSSLRVLIHAAAPCPPSVKRAAIDWLGPIIWEYYGSSEGVGLTLLSSAEWLQRPGSVGKSITGPIHILDADGCEVPSGEEGYVHFDGSAYASRAAYVGEAGSTASLFNDRGLGTVGDIGRLDEDGYLYLVGRRTDLIICGGVNIYPIEIEAVLSAHPLVHDVAVVGVDDADMGQIPVAIVQPSGRLDDPGPLLLQLAEFSASRLTRFKTPRGYIFVDHLPRNEAGKISRADLDTIVLDRGHEYIFGKHPK